MGTPYIGELGAFGLAKEVTLGTFVNPTVWIPVHLPNNAGSPDITLLASKGVYSRPDLVNKTAQGPAQGKSIKGKFDVEPENGIGELLMASFGTDTPTEVAAIVIGATNCKIDFKENGGATLNASVAQTTYAMGTSSAQNGTLCKAVKTAMEAAVGATLTYTVTYSYTTKKMTVTASSTTVQLLWLTGANNANGAYAAIGWTKADTAATLAVTSNATATTAMSHAFTRLSSANLPTYSTHEDQNGAAYPEFAGCMLNKLDLDVKAGQYLVCDFDFTGSNFLSNGVTHAPAYSALMPFKFDQAAISVAGGPILTYTDLKVSIDNMVKADPVVGGSIYSNVIASHGFKVSLAATLIVEDTVEWAKYLAGTLSSVTVVLTSTQMIVGTTPYSLTVTMGSVAYKSAPFPLKSGKLEITFQADGVYNAGNSATLTATLVNSIGTSY